MARIVIEGSIVTVDGKIVNSMADMYTPPPAAPTGYVSEHAQAAIGRWRTDAQGRLLSPKGTVLTEPEKTDPLPESFDDLGELLQWLFDHSLFTAAVKVDGSEVWNRGHTPTAYFTSSTGKLTLEIAAPTPVPVIVLPLANSQPINLEIGWPEDGQVLVRTRGFGHGPLRLTIRVPAVLPAFDHTHVGFLRLTEVPGQPVTSREAYIYVNGTLVVDDNSYNTSPMYTFSVGVSGQGQFNAPPGSIITATITNPGLGVATADVLIDFATPLRY